MDVAGWVRFHFFINVPLLVTKKVLFWSRYLRDDLMISRALASAQAINLLSWITYWLLFCFLFLVYFPLLYFSLQKIPKFCLISWCLNFVKTHSFVKVGLSPFKIMFSYLLQREPFILKAIFFLKVFKFLSWILGHVEKTACLER